MTCVGESMHHLKGGNDGDFVLGVGAAEDDGDFE